MGVLAALEVEVARRQAEQKLLDVGVLVLFGEGAHGLEGFHLWNVIWNIIDS